MGLLSSLGGIVGSAAGPVGSIIGTVAGNLIDRSETRHSAKKQFEYNNYLQNQNIDFQREMAQNKIQYAANDAKTAGFNPALGLGLAGTGGASAPQGTSPGNASNTFSSAFQNWNSQRIQENAQKSQAQLNEAKALTEAVKRGLLPRETAAKELQARAAARQADAIYNDVMTKIDRINKLLPGEMQGQAFDLVEKAYQNRLTSRELNALEKTGLTLSEWKALGKEVIDTTKFAIGAIGAGKKLSALGNAINSKIESMNKTTFTEHYNNRGKFTGATKSWKE